MHYILTNKIEDERSDAILDGESDYLIRIDTVFNEGLSLPSDDIDTPISFTFDEYTLRGNMTDHLNINSIPGPVFSINTKTLLEKKEITNIEYYQLTLIDEFPESKKKANNYDKPNPIKYTDYFIANVVGLVDCVNHEKSVLEYFYPPELRNQPEESEEEKKNNPFADENPNDIDFITKLVLDESKIDPALKVFRLKDQPNLLVFHEDIVKAIRKERLSGFVFVPVSEYTNAIPDDEADTEEKKDEKEKSANAKIMSEQKPLAAEAPQQEEKEKKKSRFNFFSDHN